MTLSVPSKKTAIDPVCGMQVDPCKTEVTTEYENKKFYFCAAGCLKAFEKKPDKYKNATAAGKKRNMGQISGPVE